MLDNLTFLPIAPLQTREGALAPLLAVLGPEDATPSPFTGQAASLPNMVVNQSSLSVSLAASLGYGAFFSGSAAGKQQGFYLDAMAFANQYEEHGSNRAIIATRWGVGIRVLVRVFDIKTDLSLNLGLVGAAMKFGYAQSEYGIEGYGIGGPEGLKIVLDGLGTLGEFNFETYLKITGPIVQNLGHYIADHKDSLTPQPIAVALARSVDPVETSRSVYHAASCIARGWTLREALEKAVLSIDPKTVRTAYGAIAGVTDEKEEPKRETAEVWLDTLR
jgi:hypothetical protein